MSAHTSANNNNNNNNRLGKDPPPPNPFGNYSLMEAQRSSGASTNSNTNEQQPLRQLSAPAKENPFLSYSFMEAQQQSFRSSSTALEPSSPTVASSSLEPRRGSALTQNDGSIGPEGELYPITESPGRGDQQGTFEDASEPPVPSRYGPGSTSIEQQAIRMLYEEFRHRAAGKIDAIVELRHDREPDLAKYLEQGADRAFDRTFEKLGSLARRRPRVIIELLLVWRKTTIDAADDWPLDGPSVLESGSKHSQNQSTLSRSHYVVKERRSLASVYILCRALSAVVSQLDASHLEGDLGDRLEELVFSQVKQVNSANLRRSQNRRDIQDLYARLIGRISEIRFASMSDRFIAELERIPMVSGSGDERIVILLHNMRFLRLRVYPIDALEESSAFLLSCAKFYSRTSGSLRLKHAWATLLTELLMPMAAVVDAEVNLPELVQAIDIIYAKAMKMAAKVRHVNVAFPLAAATLCISRRDVFHQRWLSLLEFCIQRLKDKQFRRVSMDAILRMLWVYLFRYPEASSVVLRRIDSLSRIFFPATKLHAWPKTVPPSAFVYFIVCAACYNFDFTMRQLLQGMLQIDSGWPGTTRDISDAAPILDTLNPARVAIAFQALVGVAAIAATRAREGDLDAATSDKPPALRPPFPGVGQLSGLDVFGVDRSHGDISSLAATTISGIAMSSLGSRGGPTASIATAAIATASSGFAEGARSRHGGAKQNINSSNSSSSKGKSKVGSDSNGRKGDQTVAGIIYSNRLPENIRTALRAAVGVVTRYCNALYPVFGRFVLADDRLWRLTRTVPPFSSVVLSGSPFNIENTMLLTPGPGGSYKDHRTLHAAHASGSHSSAVVVGNGGGGDISSGSGPAGHSASGNAGVGSAGASGSGGPAAARQAGAGSTPTATASRALGVGDEMTDSYYLDSQGRADGEGGGSGNGSADMTSVLAASIRQTASRYPPERQVYVDLLAVYARNVPRAQIFWEQADTGKLIDSLVQNILHVDQPLASTSRACLLNLLSPSTLLPGTATPESGRGNSSSKASVFASKAERLDGIKQAVVRATQLLRATDERFSEILAGGIFAQDAQSCVSFAQPGDPLSDALGSLTYDLPLIGCGEGGFRRFAHISSLSTASNTSNSGALLDDGHAWRRGTAGDLDSRGEGGAISAIGADDDDGDSDIGAEPSSAVVAAMDTKAARLRTSMQRTSESASHVLNGGFLHFYLDLINYLEASLYEFLTETEFASSNSAKSHIDPDHATGNTSAGQTRSSNDEASNGNESRALDAVDGQPAIASHSLVEWARLVCAIEANGVALLCSSSVRVRRLALNVLYQAGIVRRIFIDNEPMPQKGGGWVFRGSQCAYDILNVPVPAKPQSLEKEFCEEPFGEDVASNEAAHKSARQTTQPLGRMAASMRDEDVCVWDQQFPAFVRRLGSLAPETMVVARTLVCQRLYQMQPLMRQYAEMSIRSASLGAACCSAGSAAFLRLTTAHPHDKAAAAVFRPDFVTAFGRLLLFAVVSLPADDAAAAAAATSGGTTLMSGIGASSSGEVAFDSDMAGGGGGGSSSIFGHGSGGSGGNSSSSGGGRSRLAKSIARKLAPLKSNSRNNRQEQGTGLTTVAQLVRIVGVALRSDNAPLRYVTAYALSNTPPSHLRALMHELRPLAESLFDDAPALAAHRNYLHVAGADPGAGTLSGSPAAAAASSSPVSESALAAADMLAARRPRSFDSSAVGHSHLNSAAIAAAAASAAAAAAGTGTGSASQTRRRLLRQSLAQIYKHVARQLHTADASGHRLWHDDSAVAQLVSYVRETKTVLADSAAHADNEHQPLRIHFSGLVETLYSSIAAARHEARSTAASFTHETRSGLYQLLERWCGLGRYADTARDAQSRMANSVLDHIKPSSDRARAAAALDEDWFLLNIAAMRAMAVLCRAAPGRPDIAALADPGGPREKLTLFSWVSDALHHPDSRVQRIGQRAVQWTVAAAPDDAPMVRVLVQLTYGISVVSSVNNGFATGAPHASIRQTSGLGLVLGAPPPPPAAAPLTLSTDRIALGYLTALNAVLAHDSGRSLAVIYVASILPLVMFQLQSERHKIRRQALLILRVLCTYMSIDDCLTMVDRVGPSIVSDIPAIASAAAVRLTEAVADAFSAHSSDVVLEVVRQIHAQSMYGGRFSTLQAIVRPWLANVSLAAPSKTEPIPGSFSLYPTELTHDSLLVLRCMLYMTVKADLGSMSDMQDLWLALVDHDESCSFGPAHANIWLVMRYLTGLLVRYWSPALLGFVRRIVVFLTRSSHGPQLIRSLVQETMQPAATVPIGEEDAYDEGSNEACIDEILAQNAEGEALPNESWASEIPFLTTPQPADQSVRPLASTGALAMFYLGAISYECSDQLVQLDRSLAVLPPALFLLAHPEQWVRDAARTVLVNLVASERSHCITLSCGARHASGTRLMPLVDLSYIANDAAHAALGVLRGDECAAGFGNVDASSLRQAATGATPSFGHHDTRALNDSNDFLFHGWSPTIPPARGSPGSHVDSPQGYHYQSENEQNENRAWESNSIDPIQNSVLSSGSRGLDDDGGHSHKRLSVSRNDDVADPSLVADVADIPAALSQTTSPIDEADAQADRSLGKDRDRINSSLHPSHIRNGSHSGSKASHNDIDNSSNGSSPAMGAMAGPKRRSSAASRRSIGSEFADSGHRERVTLQRFMTNLSRLFSGRHSGCAQEWADVSVQWAMGCPVRPLAALALQVFSVLVAEARFGGSLVITPTRQMVLCLVDRLSNVVGDPAIELVSFTETVLAALKQTAGLAARMCAEDQAVKADLLATSLVLMRTAQSATVYSMSLSIFERIFPLVEAEEREYRRLITERTGGMLGSRGCSSSGYHLALLRGLEFASCRDRCLRLLRLTFKYNDSSDGCLLPMLSIVAHAPSLMIDAMQSAVNVQRLCIESKSWGKHSNQGLGLSMSNEPNGPASTSTLAPNAANPNGNSSGIASSIGRGMRKQNSKRRPRAPSFSANAFGSSLGLMFGSMRSDSQQQTDRAMQPPTLANSGTNDNSSLVSLASSSSSSQQPSQAPKESPSRLQLFRRRGLTNQTASKAKDSDSLSKSKESLPAEEAESSFGNDSNVLHMSHGGLSIANGSYVSLRTSQSYGSVRSNGTDNNGEKDGEGKRSRAIMVHEKYLAYLAQCSQAILSGSEHLGCGTEAMRETSQLLHALVCLVTPPPPADSSSPIQYVADLTRDIIGQFGYAVVECGQRCVAETTGILLRFLQPSTRTRLALKHIGDEQAARIFSAMHGLNQHESSFSLGFSSVPSYTGELRKLDICLQLLYSVLLASSDSSGGGANVNPSMPHGVLLDSTMAASLKHLFDLTIVAKPISDQASRVLQIMLQRFDDVQPASTSQINSGESGDKKRSQPDGVLWYEADAMILLNVARMALCRVVSQGMTEQQQPSLISTGEPAPMYPAFESPPPAVVTSLPPGGMAREPMDNNMSSASIRSVSPEMPVLIIPDMASSDYYNNSDDGLPASNQQKLRRLSSMTSESSRKFDHSESDDPPMPKTLLAATAPSTSPQQSSVAMRFAAEQEHIKPKAAGVSESGSDNDNEAPLESNSGSFDDQGSSSSSSDDGNELLAQLDQFDKELDEALRS
ncbi:Cell morphogenesis protein PAG1 [Coemansia sp. RSA 986]|nr:Cell morphogenesis protein PAG1 [Coemansia sp. RSA 986]